jgi:hypothetical protein
MKTKVYESKFLQLEFDADTKLIELTWLPHTENMTEESYKSEFLVYLQSILNLRPTKLIADTRLMDFVISPELQKWTNQTIFPKSLEIGLNKVAFVVSREFITQMSIEKTMKENEGSQFITRYFDQKEKALDWILPLS